jgi:lipid-A-disaccharide synthase
MKWSDQDAIYTRSAAEALKAARSAVVCSGTATLEAALCGCPCVVVYRGNWVMEVEYRIRKPKFDWISLPNILLGRGLVKELIQWEATSGALKSEFQAIDTDGPRRDEVLAGFRELADSLGETNCLERTVELAKGFLD